MGLDIKTYSYSYSMLQKLRQLALNCDGIRTHIIQYYSNPEPKTSFPNFIHHSDCDGIYISKSSKQYDKYYKHYNGDSTMMGDLDELKEELKRLKPYVDEKFKDELSFSPIKNAFNTFYDDVMSARKILEFH